MSSLKQDQQFVRYCFQLARKANGHVSPNPLVGCVIVKNNKILAKGYHQKLGSPHAEIVALKKINFKAPGATLYCNLEPCFHQGRTPPCVHPIIAAGIKRVVVAMRDPNPRVAGKSLRLLQRAGIRVTAGVLENEARFLNRFYLKWIATGRPYVILKVAMSLDGKIARAIPLSPALSHEGRGGSMKVSPTGREGPIKFPLPGGEGGRGRVEPWITGPQARRRVHQLRSQVDAVLVGINTVIQDNPRLNVRGIKGAHQPLRVILDSQLKIPLKSKLFRARGGRVLIFASKCNSPHPPLKLRGGDSINFIDESSPHRLSIAALLKKLRRQGVSSLLVEGGGEVFGSFVTTGHCDELILHVNPALVGAQGLPAFNLQSAKKVQIPLQLVSSQRIGRDLELKFISNKITELPMNSLRKQRGFLGSISPSTNSI